MPIYQELVDFNSEYQNLREEPIIVNDLVNVSEENREYIKELISSRYNSDMITLLPSCRCGETKGEFSTGLRCRSCNTVVKSSLEDEIETSVWYRKPIGVKKLISPQILIMLKNRFKKSGFNIIQWLCDTNYRPTVRTPESLLKKIMDVGIIRGYNNFVENFSFIMSHLFSMKEFQPVKGAFDYLYHLVFTFNPKKEEYECIPELIFSNEHLIFSDELPLPSKALLIIEKTNVGVYVDPIIINAVDAINMLVSIDVSFYDQSCKTKENRVFRAQLKLAEFYEKYYKTNLSPKQGQFRRHIYGTRTNFAFRAVISSITGPHEYDEIHIPWGIGLTAFRPHLLNKLIKLGMDQNSAIGLLLSHVEKYHPKLDKLMRELIDETQRGIEVPITVERHSSGKFYEIKGELLQKANSKIGIRGILQRN